MSSRHLYELWRITAERFGSEIALYDCSAKGSWTFGDLFAQGEQENSSPAPAFPSGNGPAFLIQLLGAWRAGAMTCPLEPAQVPPNLDGIPGHCAHVKITSASSGAAKCILFTGEQLAADAGNIVSTMGLRPDWPNLGCISLAHSYGFSNLVLPLFLHGIPLVLVPTPLPELILKSAGRFESIALPAVPALWKAWLQAGTIPHNTRLAISAGAPLSLELEREIFERLGLKIHNFYGSSECGGIAYDRLNVPREDASLAGTALDNVRLSLSESGALIVNSAAVGETYWPLGDSSLSPGRYETTDLAEIREGSVFLRGRLTDLLNVAGRKVSPEQIEAAVRAHPSVIECIVFGIPDPNHDRTDAVIATARTRRPIAISDLNLFLSAKIPTWQIPRHWWFTEELQPNSRGKISRAEWKRKFLESRNQEQ